MDKLRKARYVPPIALKLRIPTYFDSLEVVLLSILKYILPSELINDYKSMNKPKLYEQS